MEDLQSSEESAFVLEDVTAIIKEVRALEHTASPGPFLSLPSQLQAVDSVLSNATYQHTKVPQWTSNVIVSPCWWWRVQGWGGRGDGVCRVSGT